MKRREFPGLNHIVLWLTGSLLTSLISHEDETALVELSERLRTQLQPVGALEELLVDRMITAAWRLRRLIQVETGIFTWELDGIRIEQAEREVRTYERTELDTLVLMGIHLTDEGKHQQARARV